MSQTSTAHAVSLQQTLKSVEANINTLANTPNMTEKLQELTELKRRLIEQIQASTPNAGVLDASSPQQHLSSPMNQISSPIASMSSGTVTLGNTIPIKKEVHPVVITQTNPPSSQLPVQQNVEDDKILSKHRLQKLVKEIDPNEQLDDDVEEMLMQITDDFIENVVGTACNLAKHRNSKSLELKDMKLHLEKQWNITVPGYGPDEIRPFKKSLTTEAHKQRLALIRKATKK